MEKSYLFLMLLLILSFSNISFAQNKLSPGDHFADINGIVIHYYVSGAGPVCLFPSPGWGPDITIYKNSLCPLEKYFTMVYYDTRISGQSTGPDDPTKYTGKDFMEDMEALRVYLEQPKVWLMGHSMGGFQVLNYGIHHNDKLNGIITLHAFAGRDSLYKAEYNKMVMKRQGEPWFEKAYRVLYRKDSVEHSFAEYIQIILPFYFHNTDKIEDFRKLGDPQLSAQASKNFGYSKFGKEYLFPDLPRIKVPALIVSGDDDFICNTVSQGDRIHKNIPNSDELIIKDAGHFAWVEQPEQFFMDLTKWLEKQNVYANE